MDALAEHKAVTLKHGAAADVGDGVDAAAS